MSERRCPDDGRCHHGCIVGCWRVAGCAPLSAAYEEWPESVKVLGQIWDENRRIIKSECSVCGRSVSHNGEDNFHYAFDHHGLGEGEPINCVYEVKINV
jgi:hypothetical protein